MQKINRFNGQSIFFGNTIMARQEILTMKSKLSKLYSNQCGLNKKTVHFCYQKNIFTNKISQKKCL